MSNVLDSSPVTSAGDETRERLLLIDGFSLLFQSFHGSDSSTFVTSQGVHTNAVCVFAAKFMNLLKYCEPQYLAVAIDLGGPTFRHDLLPQYKGGRKPVPEELLSQIPLMKQMLEVLGVKTLSQQGFEADDIIASLATQAEQEGVDTYIVSTDRDMHQLLSDHVRILRQEKNKRTGVRELVEVDNEYILEHYGIPAERYADLAALTGEAADNIPGVPGVGPGFAAKWLAAYGSLASVLDHADEITGKRGEALRNHIDQVRLNRKVNALVRDLSVVDSVRSLTWGAQHIDLEQFLIFSYELEWSMKRRGILLNAFNHGKSLSDTPAFQRAQQALEAYVRQHDRKDNKLEAPEIVQITTGQQLLAWLSAHDCVDEQAYRQQVAKRGEEEAASPSSEAIDDELEILHEAVERVAHYHTAAGNAHPALDNTADLAAQTECSSSALDGVQARCTASEIDESRLLVVYARGVAKPHRSKLESLTLLAGNEAAYIGDIGLLCEDASDPNNIAQILAYTFKTTAAHLCVYGLKELNHLLSNIGLRLVKVGYDVKMMSYLAHPDEHRADLRQNATEVYQYQFPQPELPKNKLFNAEDITGDAIVAPRPRASIEALDAVIIRRMLLDLLDDQQFVHHEHLLNVIEMPVTNVLFRMESAGAAIDVERLEYLHSDFAAQAEQAQRIAYEAIGKEVNLQSPKQLQEVLYTDLGLEPVKKTKTGEVSTNASVLQELYLNTAQDPAANTFLGALLQHREMNKLKQIAASLRDCVDSSDQRVHTRFEQTVAATGRLSSADPNLQNIPNRMAAGREIRSVFVPGSDYDCLLSCDYSQVELRIMADLSADEALIEAFKSGVDFHKYVASLVYDKPIDQISSDERTHVKAMSYGLAYGLSTYGLSEQLGISSAQAQKLKSQYFSVFGAVRTYLDDLVHQAEQQGYTQTLYGRRRYFPDLHSSMYQRRVAAQRAALNAPIQGTAADIMKIAMIRAQEALLRAGLKSRITLQIHDELVLEVVDQERDQVIDLVRDAMQGAVQLKVPLDVSIGMGNNWQSAAH